MGTEMDEEVRRRPGRSLGQRRFRTAPYRTGPEANFCGSNRLEFAPDAGPGRTWHRHLGRSAVYSTGSQTGAQIRRPPYEGRMKPTRSGRRQTGPKSRDGGSQLVFAFAHRSLQLAGEPLAPTSVIKLRPPTPRHRPSPLPTAAATTGPAELRMRAERRPERPPEAPIA